MIPTLPSCGRIRYACKKTDTVTRQAPVRDDLRRAAGLQGVIEKYRRWEESLARQDAEKCPFFCAVREDPSPDNNCCARVRVRLNNREEGGKSTRLRRCEIATFAFAEALPPNLSPLAVAIRGTRQHDCLRWQKTALQEPPARAEDFRKNTRRHLAKLVTALDKARKIYGELQ